MMYKKGEKGDWRNARSMWKQSTIPGETPMIEERKIRATNVHGVAAVLELQKKTKAQVRWKRLCRSAWIAKIY